MSEDKKPLTSLQIQQQNNQLQIAFNHAIDKMKIRQWAVEKVVDIAKNEKVGTGTTNLKDLTQFFYDFVTNMEEKS